MSSRMTEREVARKLAERPGTEPPPDLLERIKAEIPAELWLGAPEGGLSGARLLGKPVLLEFWTYLCYNCKNVEGWMKDTYRTYAPEGLQVIGVHTPEFDVERKVENVKDYISKNGIEYPVAIDARLEAGLKCRSTSEAHVRPAPAAARIHRDRAGRHMDARGCQEAGEKDRSRRGWRLLPARPPRDGCAE